MAKYAMFAAHGHGHVNPTLAIAQELVARGEQVIYYLPETFRPAVEATGASFRLYEGEAFKHLRSGQPAFTPGKKVDTSLMVGRMMETMVQESVSMLPQLLEEMRIEQVDSILYDRIFLPARLLSDLRMLTQAADLNIVFLPRAFQPAGETFDERFVFVGPSLQAQRHYSGDFPLDRLDKHPQLYISLGTAFNNQAEFYNLCFDAFGQTEWQVVLAFGQQIDPAELKEPPANFIAVPHVPQLEVLARADVFVSHGGMNSTMESLTFGVPLVVVPQMSEQEMTARRVQELGLGLALEKETLTAEKLRAAVEQIAHDPSFRVRVQEMQNETRQAGGFQRAVDAIIRYTHGAQQAKVRKEAS